MNQSIKDLRKASKDVNEGSYSVIGALWLIIIVNEMERVRISKVLMFV